MTVTAVEPLVDDAADGFLPGDGGGHDVAATLTALPGVFTAIQGNLAALAAWMDEVKLGGHPAGLVSGMADCAGAVALEAEEAARQFRQANEFWLAGNEGRAPAMTQLAGDAAAPLIPGDGQGEPPAYILADTLAALPWFFELIAEQLAALGDWMAEHGLAGPDGTLLGPVTSCACILTGVAEETSARFQAENRFWLSGRRTHHQ